MALVYPVWKEEVEMVTDKAMGWKVLLWNCNCHTFADVYYALQRAVRCSLDKAKEHAQTIHEEGHDVVYSGHKERCEAVAWVLGEIGLRVTLTQ